MRFLTFFRLLNNEIWTWIVQMTRQHAGIEAQEVQIDLKLDEDPILHPQNPVVPVGTNIFAFKPKVPGLISKNNGLRPLLGSVKFVYKVLFSCPISLTSTLKCRAVFWHDIEHTQRWKYKYSSYRFTRHVGNLVLKNEDFWRNRWSSRSSNRWKIWPGSDSPRCCILKIQ